jgi:FMN reductase
MILILSSSLNATSNSRLLAREAWRILAESGKEVEWVDLRDHPLPLCDGAGAYEHPEVLRLGARLRAADAIIVAAPIYNYDVNAAVKNAIELTGDAWENKVVGFLCAAGGMASFMSIMALANSLMLDFRSVIVPRFVYATRDAFSSDDISDEGVRARVKELALATARLARAVKAAA